MYAGLAIWKVSFNRYSITRCARVLFSAWIMSHASYENNTYWLILFFLNYIKMLLVRRRRQKVPQLFRHRICVSRRQWIQIFVYSFCGRNKAPDILSFRNASESLNACNLSDSLSGHSDKYKVEFLYWIIVNNKSNSVRSVASQSSSTIGITFVNFFFFVTFVW